jgi:hypothetical protein
MAQTCTRCSRPNPPDAVYCYFDGIALAGRGRGQGPVAAGSRRFANPFVFPSGRACRTFNELALACQEDWSTASEMLQQGFLESFLDGANRHDLALAAREAARFPDRDRGLDQLLGKLPSDALTDPKLRLDPLEVNLGVLKIGDQPTFELHLENQGMRLLYGSVSCPDALWLGLGEANSSEKHFQFTHELAIPVHVRGTRLRASKKPLQAKLEVESNGGSFTVLVRADVPVTAFPTGLLAGAKTPRQVAEKSRDNPKEAAGQFEQGEVEKWYRANGWDYPVKIPAASGVAAVQQFFEALGFTKAPKVRISQRALSFQANPGEALAASVEVSTQEKRPVYAHATANVPWLEVARPRFNGRSVLINLAIPNVPNKPGMTLEAKLTVQANGNQRFVVPVTVEVGGAFNFNAPEPEPDPAPAPQPEPEPVVAEVVAVPDRAEPVQAVIAAEAVHAVPPAPKPKRPAQKEMEPPRDRRPVTKGAPLWLHALPAVALLLAVLGVLGYDLANPAGNKDDPNKLGAEEGWQYDLSQLKDKKPLLGVQFNPDERFGLVMLGVKDPQNKDRPKRLTASEVGDTNNTIVRIGGFDYKFGKQTPDNKWLRNRKQVKLPAPRRGWYSIMQFRGEKIQVKQLVEIVPGQTGLLDTCLIYYTIWNYGTSQQKVGLRIMLDTYIGANDGVPFTVPGRKGFVTKKEDFDGDKVPDYIEAIENPDNSADPGTTVRMGLRNIRLPNIELEEPSRLRICAFENANAEWEWPAKDMDKDPKDSCVAIYWAEKTMEPDTVRHLAITYGLSKLEVGDLLALSCPSSVLPNREFVVTAYVWNAKKGQKVKLEVPEGLKLAAGEEAEKVIEEAAVRTQVFWHLKAGKEGTYTLEASSGKAKARERPVKVKGTSIFG